MSNLAQALRQADIFYRLTPDQLAMIADICEARTYATGDVIFYEQDDSDELYIIMQGAVDILVNPALVSVEPLPDMSAVTIATLRRGQSFGEIALVDQGLRSATARAAQDNTRLLVIPRDRLNQLCEQHPALGYRLMLNLAADLALKIRSADLDIREKLLYSHNQK